MKKILPDQIVIFWRTKNQDSVNPVMSYMW